MKDKVYIHLKTGDEYLVLMEVEMKHPDTGEWLQGISYQSLSTGHYYVRGRESFLQSFAQKEYNADNT